MSKRNSAVLKCAPDHDRAANDVADFVCGLDEQEQESFIAAFKISEDFPTALQSLSTSNLNTRTMRRFSDLLEADPLLARDAKKDLNAVLRRALDYVVECERDARALSAFMQRLDYDEQSRLAKIFKRKKLSGSFLHTLNSTGELHHRTLVSLTKILRSRDLIDETDEPTRAFIRAMENVVRTEKKSKSRRWARAGTAIAESSKTGVKSADSHESPAWVVFPHGYWRSEMHRLVMNDLKATDPKSADAIRIYYEKDLTLKGVQEHFGVKLSASHGIVKKAQEAYRQAYLERLADGKAE